jgi:superoxide reductase
MSDVKFYRCNHCGNIVAVIEDGKVTPMCCGEKMELLAPNTVDAAQEKHVPVVSENGDLVEVTVGSVEHPMTEEHLIQFIAYADDDKLVVKHLKAGDAPKATFHKGDALGSVYAYCNLHGLWKA